MDYKGYTCPVCHEAFKDGDDIVVCPDCGTPHHRACYEEAGACINAGKHKEGYTWEAPAPSGEEQDTAACVKCGFKNNKDALFCNRCGTPLSNQGTQGQPPQGRSPFGAGMPVGPQMMFDPMAGVDPEEEFADEVKASDLAAYVKVNTPYYMTVFNKIKKFGSGRFNLSAFLFSGGWMLYRKQYVTGAVFTAIFVLTTVFSSLYFDQFAQIYDSLSLSANSTSIFAIAQESMSLPPDQLWQFMLSPLLEFLRLISMIVCGVIGNKLYYKHCIKQVKKEKAAAQSESMAAEALQKKGGVNTILAMVLLFSYMIMNLLNFYLSMGAV